MNCRQLRLRPQNARPWPLVCPRLCPPRSQDLVNEGIQEMIILQRPIPNRGADVMRAQKVGLVQILLLSDFGQGTELLCPSPVYL